MQREKRAIPGHCPVTQWAIIRPWVQSSVHLTTSLLLYIERGNRMKNIKTRVEELTSNNKKLQEQEQMLRAKYDQVWFVSVFSRNLQK